MRVAKLYSFSDIRIEDVPVPRVGPGDALLRTTVCGICSGDVMQWYIEKKAPLVIGHEPVGEIVETGENVSSFRRGDRVFVHHHAPCFSCRRCRRGNYVQCETWRRTNLVPGGISEFILIPRINLEHDTIRIPDGMSDEDASLIEPLACVVKAQRRVHLTGGETVLVIGLGAMGQIHILLARRNGAERIVGADLVPYRLRKAKDFGADEVIDVSAENLTTALRELTDGEMADVVIVNPNSVVAMEQGIGATGPGGTVLFFTPAKPDDQLVIHPNDLYFKDISLITSYSCGPDDTREALRIIGEGVVTAEKIITHRFPIERTEDAFRLTAEAKNSLKCAIVFGENG